MPGPTVGKTLRERLGQAIMAIAALVGLWYGFAFGYRLGGMPMGAFMGIICGAFGALMASGVATWIRAGDKTTTGSPD
ncbi:MAG: hypothetical protein WCJ69_14725 [Betaproteobacteria bacterium]|jgi:hypothetical protein